MSKDSPTKLGGLQFPRVWARLGALAGAITVVTLVVLATVEGWSAEAWTAIAAWATTGIALAAGLIALSQLGEARRLRAEQAQPYVVVSMEQSRPHSKAIDLVVTNLGKTAAREVHLEIDPTPKRGAGGELQPIWLPDELPVLVPGQQWRTLWDFTTARGGFDLPDRHTAVVRYADERDAQFEYSYVLAWAPFLHRASLVVKEVHEGVESLGKIEAALKTVAKALARSG